MNSSGRMPFEMFTAGASQMWDLEESWATPDVGKNLLEAFVECGTHIFQGNVTSVEKLIDAKKHPEKYPNLCVRVGGYSAHFIYLSEVLQDSIIERILHKG
jgi:pyruvate-formate lyase